MDCCGAVDDNESDGEGSDGFSTISGSRSMFRSLQCGHLHSRDLYITVWSQYNSEVNAASYDIQCCQSLSFLNWCIESTDAYGMRA